MKKVRDWLPPSWLIALVTTVMVGVLALNARRVLQMKEDLRRTTAIENAARFSEALQAFRTVYTSEVVEPAAGLGQQAVHDYKTRPGTLPLPATLTKVLGAHLGSRGDVRVYLYSDFPFPRTAATTVLDGFQRNALRALRSKPDVPVVEFEPGEKGTVIRYAVADLMRPECVACHNTHPESPKRDWGVGDVRGVLEVNQTVSAAAGQLSIDLASTEKSLIAIGLLGLGILGLTAWWHRQAAASSQRAAESAQRAQRRIEEEMAGRQAAEEARVAAERRALHVQKLESLGVMASGIAHDFNNLLVSILGNAQLALQSEGLSDSVVQQLKGVDRAGQQAADLIHQILAYAGDVPVELGTVDLNECIEHLTPLLTIATRSGESLTLDLETDLPAILANRTQVEQVLLNLVTNATEAGSEGEVKITLRTGVVDLESLSPSEQWLGDGPEEGTYVFFEVEDDGCGLDEETRTKMFDPFFSTKGPGRGLGLATMLGIVHTSGGSILVSSELGKGTTLRISFPSQQVESSDVLVPIGQVSPLGQRKRVLVIDDADDPRETTVALLQSRGFDVSAATDGADGLAQIEAADGAFDAVLLDMMMPGLDGLGVYKRIRGRGWTFSVVFYSGMAASSEVQGLVRAGDARYLRKPVSMDQLVAALVGEA